MKKQSKEEFYKEVYLHISNGGVTFKVCDSVYGPMIMINSSSFGMKLGELDIYTNKESLLALADLFQQAADKTKDCEISIPKAIVYGKRSGKIKDVVLPEIEEKDIKTIRKNK